MPFTLTARRIGLLLQGKIINLVIGHIIVAHDELILIAAAERNATHAALVDVAVLDAAVVTACDLRTPFLKGVEVTAVDGVVLPAIEDDSAFLTAGELDSLDGDVRGVGCIDKIKRSH